MIDILKLCKRNLHDDINRITPMIVKSADD